MKTIQVCIGLFMLAIVPFGCSDDDLSIKPIDEIASGEAVLELQLEAYALSVDEVVLTQRRDELLIILEEDPGNDNAQGELVEIDNELINIEDRAFSVAESIVGFGLGPIPPLPPCDPGPENNCPFDLGNVNKFVLDRNLQDFSFEIISPETEEVLFVLEEFNDSELNENLLESPFEVDQGQFPEEVIVMVRKIEGEEEISYRFFATF